MEQSKSIRGGVSLCHSVVDEKHCYKVENALTHCSSTFRKGDIISMINNQKTEDMPPEEFIKMLSSQSPILTIHQASTDMEDGQCLESDSIHAFREEEITLNFRLEMVREQCLEAEEETEIEPEWESDDMEDKELVVVSMTETNVEVVRGRGCDPENPCNNCGINGCNVNEVIIAPKKREVLRDPKQCVRMGDINKVKDVFMSSLVQKIVRPDKKLSFSEKVTIYYYKSNFSKDEKIPSPVVLNVTGTNKFLKCTHMNQEVILTLECYEQDKLKDICNDNPATWPFVFYMKTEGSNRLFESAANQGWYIRTVQHKDSVWVEEKDKQEEGDIENFYFLIFLNTTENKRENKKSCSS